MKYKHGQKCTCYIKGDLITDARISIDTDGKIYICQNIHSGFYGDFSGLTPQDKLGYQYGWKIGNGSEEELKEEGVTNLILINDKETQMGLVKLYKEQGLPEPKKTYRKIELTGSDDMLTEEGLKIFCSWLLTQKEIGDKFYKEVAKPIREEVEKSEEE